MNVCGSYLGCVLMICLSTCSCDGRSPRERAETYGATAKLSINVVDEGGQFVPDADYDVYFSLSVREGKTIKGKSNAKGGVTVSGKTTGDVYVNVRKPGFYETNEKIELAKDENRAVSLGRWMPEQLVTNVVLRKIGKPIELISPKWSKDFMISKPGVPMGFDLEKQDWVKPLGKGDIVDFELTYESDGKKFTEYTGSKLGMRFVRPFDGAYIRRINSGSKLKTCHSAETNGVFKNSFIFWEERGRDRKMFGHVLGKDEYMILRTRSRIDEKGRFLGGCYSMIVGGITFGWCFESFGCVGFRSFMNPVFNDPNLEEKSIYNTPNFRTTGGFLKTNDGK